MTFLRLNSNLNWFQEIEREEDMQLKKRRNISDRKNRREFLKTVILGVAAIAVHGCKKIAKKSTAEKGKPNIILILTDDQGWTDTSVQMMENRPDSKSDYYQTPALERLAREGMRFSNAYASAPVCLPTRHSIQFGKTPARLKSTTLSKTGSKCDGEISIAQMIKAADPDYVTAHYGKCHMNRSPQDLGYDQSDGLTGSFEGDWFSREHQRLLSKDDPKRIFSLTKRANAFMEEQVREKRPFYLQVSHYAAHVQHMALETTKDKYKKLPRGKKCIAADYETPKPSWNNWIIEYAAMIEDLDTGLAMLLDKIDQLGISDNTYIIFLSDNGGGFRGNTPLRGGKANLWEGGIRVPMVVRGPGIRAGSMCDEPIAGWDLFPTFSELIENKNPLPAYIDGGSLRPLFENGGVGTVKRSTEGLIFHFPWYWVPQSAIRIGSYKLLKNLDTQELNLFDLSVDIEEKNNLLCSMPAKAEELHKKLKSYLENVNAENARFIRAGYRQDLIREKENLEREINTFRNRPDLIDRYEKNWMWVGDGFGQFDAMTFKQKRLEQANNALKRLENKMKQVGELYW